MNERTTQMERLSLIVGCALVLMMSFETIGPFFIAVPPASVRLIDQQQTILQSVFLILVGYLWGNSVANRTKDATISTLAQTAQTAGAMLSPDTMTLATGQSATATASEAGTIIEKKEPAP